MMSTPSLTLPILSLLALSPLTALARTDLSGCTSFTSMVTVDPTAHGYGNIYPSVIHYVPDSLEICAIPDCGGGRAPPKTNVPGCPLYSGTASPTPSFLSADPLAVAPAGAAASTSAAGAPLHAAAPTSGVVAGETLQVAAVETSSGAAAAGTTTAAAGAEEEEEAEDHTLVSGAKTVTVATVTSTLGPVSVIPTTAGTAPGASSHANGTGLNGVKGNGTVNGNGTGQPSKPLDTTAAGNVLGVTLMAGLSVALAAAAFVL